MHPHGGQNQDDLELVRAIRQGSIPAWHTFVDRYTGLLHTVINRYFSDREEVRTVYVDVLSDLYRGKLASYEGRSALSTWLVPVARSAAVDRHRKLRGRWQVPEEVRSLGGDAVLVFKLFYLNGLSLDAVVHRMEASGSFPGREGILDTLSTIESRVGRRALRSLRYQSHAAAIGATSARLLEFLDHFRDEQERGSTRSSPDARLLEAEARRTVERVLALVARLPQEEREVLSLRLERGWTARRISETLGMGSPRRVYSLLDQAVRRLRRWAGLAPSLGAGSSSADRP